MPIDPCFAELLSDPRNTVNPPPDHIPMEKVRRAADSAMEQGTLPALSEIRDDIVHLDGRDIPIRTYRPHTARDLPVILFCHGGGFVWGSIDTHDGICRRLAHETGGVVVSVGYRLAPETRFPGPVEDAMGVLRDITERAEHYGIDPTCIALCGDSAGGSICVSVAGRAADAGIGILHIGLLYPALDPNCASDSQIAFADGPLLTKAAMEWFWDCYLGPGNRSGFRILPNNLTGFPQTNIVTAEFDPLRDEAEDFFRCLQSDGVKATLTRAKGMIHGFLSLDVTTSAIPEYFRDFARVLREAFDRV